MRWKIVYFHPNLPKDRFITKSIRVTLKSRQTETGENLRTSPFCTDCPKWSNINKRIDAFFCRRVELILIQNHQ